MAAPRKVDRTAFAAYVREHPGETYARLGWHFRVSDHTARDLCLALGLRDGNAGSHPKKLENADLPPPDEWETGVRPLVEEAARRFPLPWFTAWATAWVCGLAQPEETAIVEKRCRRIALAALLEGDMGLAAVASYAEVAAMDAGAIAARRESP